MWKAIITFPTKEEPKVLLSAYPIIANFRDDNGCLVLTSKDMTYGRRFDEIEEFLVLQILEAVA